MNRKEIKRQAWEKIKGNKWNIIWPLLLIAVIQSVLSNVLGGTSNNALANLDLSNLDANTIEQLSERMTISPVNGLLGLIFGIVDVAYLKYLLNIVRTGKAEFNDIIDCFKEKWLQILILNIVLGVLVGLGFVFLIIPGIILSLAYSMASLLIVDTEKEGIEALKKSRAMMKGYKWNYFVFLLSFIGWYLLVPITLGVVLIWLVPYVSVAEVLYYEELKKITK